MSNIFGGSWTLIKLELLRDYLRAYTTAFKNMPYYHLVYLDAFAGNGRCVTNEGIIDGSARIALNTDRFDEYIFIENKPNFVTQLRSLKQEYPDKKITVIQGDCNEVIESILDKYNWKKNRALAFFDPYNMQLSFDTLRATASTGSFDIWYLFPLGATTRCLRNDGRIHTSVGNKLNYLFGDIHWKNKLYYNDPQLNLFDESPNIIRKEQQAICCYFKERMLELFPSVLCPACLRNSKESPLFLLYFAVSNTSKQAQNLANRIAGHLLDKQDTYLCGKSR